MDKSLALEGEGAGGAVSTAEFEKVMVNMGFDPALSAFKGEYARLLAALKGSLSSEKRLVTKIGALNEEIVLNAGKVTQALRLAEEDGATIDDLRKQLERAWAMVEGANTRAEAAGQTSQGFQAEAAQLKSELGRMHELLAGDSIEELAAARDNLGSRLDTALVSLAAEKARGDGLVAELEARSQKLNQRRDEVRALRGEITLKSAEEAKTSRMVAALQADVARAKEEAEGRAAADALARSARGELEASIARLQKGLEAQRASTAAALSEASEGAARLRRAEEELRGYMDKASAAGEARAALERELKESREACAKERAGAAKLAAKVEAAGKEVAAAKAAGEAAGVELGRLRSELAALGKSLSAEQGAVREREKAAARLEREKAGAQARVAAGEAALSEAEVEAARREGELKAAGGEVAALSASVRKLQMAVDSLQRGLESERRGAEAARAATAEALEAAAVKEAMVVELEAREREGALKLRALQASYEALRNECAAARKAAAAGEEEAAELARRERISANHIAQLKDEVMAKDRYLVTEQFEVASLGKRLVARTGECEKLRVLLGEAGSSVRLQGEDLARCKGLLRSADEDSLAQKRAYDSLVCERDALAAQIKSRNDDLALARDRMGILEVAMAKGERAYQARETEIKVHKLKIADLLREQQLSLSSASGMPLAARTQIASLQRDLDAEKAKITALSAELETPLNVHRWRKLEGSDPELLDLLARYASVQRRLIVKTEEVVERDLMLADKEERVAELKAHLAAQPGPELAEQLTQTQHLLSERTRQLKSVASEVNMWQTQVGEARYEVARLKEALAEARRAVLEEKAKGRAGVGGRGGGAGGGSHAGKPGSSGEAPLVVLGASGGVRGGGFTAPAGLL